VVPEPTDCVGVELKPLSPEFVAHSNHAFVASPLAVTLPFRVAVVAPTDVAAKVVTTGAAPGYEVVKLVMALSDSPFVLDAMTRK
jgi:hypothetical protein